MVLSGYAIIKLGNVHFNLTIVKPWQIFKLPAWGLGEKIATLNATENKMVWAQGRKMNNSFLLSDSLPTKMFNMPFTCPSNFPSFWFWSHNNVDEL